MDNNKNSNSSLDTVILLSDTEETTPKSPKRKCKRKHHKKSSKTHSEKSKTNSEPKSQEDSKINISQKIQVDNKKFQCVINLNTNVYEHKSKCKKKSACKHRSRHSENNRRETKTDKRRKSKERKSEDKNCKSSDDSRNNSVYRIPPLCQRKTCWNASEGQRERSRRKRIISDMDEYYNKSETKIRPPRKDFNIKQEIPNVATKDNSYEAKIDIKQNASRILLSPISSSPLEDVKDNISYEEISNASLDVTNIVVTKPACRHWCRHSKYCKHRPHKQEREATESKLDTLIKRTKERERKLVAKSRNWYTSTPNSQEFSSGDFPMTCSDMEMSMNSATTLVLGARTPYSLVDEGNLASFDTDVLSKIQFSRFSSETEKLSNYQVYSPSSPMRELYTPVEKEVDYKLIKEEPTVKIDYSPTHSPESTPKLYLFSDVKKETEIKPEPSFPLELSPIYREDNSELGLVSDFLKIENVKTEPRFI